MAHLETPEAVDAPVNDDSAAAVMDKYLTSEYGEGEEESTDEEAELDGEELEGEDLETGDADEEGDEPETAIEPPVSLNAEEKKAFAAASPEAQQAWAAAETRRNAQVQEATTKAAERERVAQTAAEQAEVAADQRRAAQLWTFMEQFAPQMPSPQLAQTDPASYIAAKAQYDYEAAQFAQMAQQIEAIDANARQRGAEIDQQQRVQDLMSVGKLADPATRDEYLKTSLGLVEELGLDPKAFEEVAGSEDFKALEKIADWKSKAERFDKAMSRKMQRVREGKPRTLRPGAAQPERSGREATNAITRLKQTGSDADALAAFTALGI